MAVSNTQSISTLLQRSSLDDHEDILRSCNAALKKSKSDVLAQHVKAIALLKLDRFGEALHVFEEAGEPLQQKAPLEYAYSLYKNGNHEKAAEGAGKVKEGRGARHLEAQAVGYFKSASLGLNEQGRGGLTLSFAKKLYRAEDFVATRDIYRELSSSDLSSTERHDVHINAGAAEAQLIWSGAGESADHSKPKREDLESFEPAYNAACVSIAGGELRQAEVLLKRAKGAARGFCAKDSPTNTVTIRAMQTFWGLVR
jgi:signal recognition particle subunit SRP72